MPGGRPETKDAHAIYRIDRLIQEEGLSRRAAILRTADELLLKGDERRKFYSRLRAKYPKWKEEGRIPQREPVEPGLEEAIDNIFAQKQKAKRETEETLERLEQEALAYGFDLRADLLQILDELRKERDRLELIARRPPEVMAHALLEGGAPDPESAKLLHLDAKKRLPEIERQAECLANLLRLRRTVSRS